MTPSERLRRERINQLGDQLATILRKPTAAPLLTPRECISSALSLLMPGPASDIMPDGRGPRLIELTLRKMGYKIMPMERADYEQ